MWDKDGVENKGKVRHSQQCMHQEYDVGEGAKEEKVGPPGRAFMNRHPESSPDLRLYSTKEHPLRDLIASCGLRGYVAWPVFDLSLTQCLGVLELLILDGGIEEDYHIMLEGALMRAELRSTHSHDYEDLVYWKPAPEEIGEMLELAIDAIPQLHLAQVWMPCQQCGDTMSCMKRVVFINSADMKLGARRLCDFEMRIFLEACETLHIQSKTGKSCFFQSLCDVSICEYPLAHYAQQARLSSCFTVCLQRSRDDVNDLFIVEFFLQPHSREDDWPCSTLHLLIHILKKLRIFKITSEEQLTELPIGLCTKSHPASLQSNRIAGYNDSLFVSYLEEYLNKFWEVKRQADKSFLTTLDQHFALGTHCKGLCWYRKHCTDRQYFVDDGAKEEELGPLGRAFQSRSPEFTPDIRLYSTKEFPHRDYAIQCGLRTYLALPIFNLHKSECLGVLEWIDFEEAKQGEPHTLLIRNALEEANLESPHFRLCSLEQESEKFNRDSELHELEKMLRKAIGISQLSFMAQVWVPCSQCTDTHKNIVCVKQELVERWHAYRGDWFMSTTCIFYSSFLAKQVQNMNIFVLFLSFLLPIMKETLKSFKLASGKQLGEELVVEVISFDKNDEFTSFELHQPNVLPVRFEVTQYIEKEPRYQNSTHQLVHDTPNRHDSSKPVPETQPDDAASTDSEEGVTVTTKKTKGKGTQRVFILAMMIFNYTLGRDSKMLQQSLVSYTCFTAVSRSTLKRACRDYGIKRWPSRQNNKKNPSLFEASTSNKRVRSSDQQVLVSSSNNPPPQISPVHNQNVLQTSGIESSQNHTKLTEDGFVLIKAKFGEDTVKLQLLLSSGIEKLKEEVGKRFNLMNGSFKLYYLDEDEWILLAIDDDLQLCMKTSTASGKTPIQILVK
ncbi:protein NLP4 [Sesamum angolense]|uniref:Protein NLP4 n=1 Tax=Sesamum angolense TaxID=2727404 RepID=A0AAE2C014_9LAMI|nr:protein NLP4 [Sesamum angolense]